MRNKKRPQVDPLEAMAGGYAPNAGTPTHFLGREATTRVIRGTRKSVEARRRRVAANRKKVAAVRGPKTRIEHCKPAPGVTIAYEVTAAGDEHPYDKGEIAQTETPIDESGSSLTDVSIVGQTNPGDDTKVAQGDRIEEAMEKVRQYGQQDPMAAGGNAANAIMWVIEEMQLTPEEEQQLWDMSNMAAKRAQTAPGEDTLNLEEQDMMGGNVTPGDDMMGEMEPMTPMPGMDIETGSKAQEEGDIIDNTPGMAGYARRYPGMPEKAEAIRHVMAMDEWQPEDEYPPTNKVPQLPGVKPDDGIGMEYDSFAEDQDYGLGQAIEDGMAKEKDDMITESENGDVEPDPFASSMPSDPMTSPGVGGMDYDFSKDPAFGGEPDMIEESQQMANDGGAGSAGYTGPETDSHFSRLLPQHLADAITTPGEEREDEKEDQMIPSIDSFEDAKASALFD